MNTDTQEFAIEIAGGVTVCVPADVSLMTPYILLEQEDWFEDEIKFVREYLQPGMRVIDIGVNYGTYFLTSAKQIGETGKIWGFEPSTQCCSFVESSIRKNNFKNINLIQAGLSDRVGKAYLSLSENTELNTVAEALDEGESGESIELLTLDHCLDELNLTDIDFMKMDAEGEESNIIKGGKQFFASNSPLVMFELKHGNAINHKLIGEFNEIGYQTYRLVPGLNCLVPFNASDEIDGFQLNLFCCKPDCADVLRDQGWLGEENSIAPESQDIKGLWKNYLMSFSYAQELADLLGEDMDLSGEPEFAEYYRALDLYASARNIENTISQRHQALVQSYALLHELLGTSGHISIALSFVRVASELGKRQQATEMLSVLIDAIQRGENISLPIPFLAPSETFDSIVFGENLESWLYSSIFSSHQFLAAYSSYYIGQENIEVINLIDGFSFDIPEIKRRKYLTMIRFAEPGEKISLASKTQLTTNKANLGLWKKLIQ